MKHMLQSDASHTFLVQQKSAATGLDSQFFDAQRLKGSSDFTKFEEIVEPVGDSTFFP